MYATARVSSSSSSSFFFFFILLFRASETNLYAHIRQDSKIIIVISFFPLLLLIQPLRHPHTPPL